MKWEGIGSFIIVQILRPPEKQIESCLAGFAQEVDAELRVFMTAPKLPELSSNRLYTDLTARTAAQRV